MPVSHTTADHPAARRPSATHSRVHAEALLAVQQVLQAQESLNWDLAGDHCSFSGVVCDNSTRRVVGMCVTPIQLPVLRTLSHSHAHTRARARTPVLRQ